jgi:uncharacterized protein
MENFQIVNKESKNRFEADLGNDVAFIEYSEGSNYISLDHTFVPDSHRGQGIADKMIKEVLDYIKEMKIPIIARCPVVKKYIETHPAYLDLLKREF